MKAMCPLMPMPGEERGEGRGVKCCEMGREAAAAAAAAHRGAASVWDAQVWLLPFWPHRLLLLQLLRTTRE